MLHWLLQEIFQRHYISYVQQKHPLEQIHVSDRSDSHVPAKTSISLTWFSIVAGQEINIISINYYGRIAIGEAQGSVDMRGWIRVWYLWSWNRCRFCNLNLSILFRNGSGSWYNWPIWIDSLPRDVSGAVTRFTYYRPQTIKSYPFGQSIHFRPVVNANCRRTRQQRDVWYRWQFLHRSPKGDY